MKKIYIGFWIVFLWATILAGKTWQVPSNIPTIKSAVEDSAQYGDTVLVAPGIYDTSSGEVFPINMKNGVVLISEKGADSTVIDANSTARVITCEDVNSLTVISGFTITGGYANQFGGGIYCRNSSLTIVNNLILQNTAHTGPGGGETIGGGIYCYEGSPVITYNLIQGNIARDWWQWTVSQGGGIASINSASLIKCNLIIGNLSLDALTPGMGGGIFISGNIPSIIYGNTIDSNATSSGGYGIEHGKGGGIYASSESLKITNNIIVNSMWGGGILCVSCSTITISHNDVWNNVNGDFINCPPGVGDTTWGTNRNGIPCDSFYNIGRDPIFAVCGEDSFFLSQIDAGQLEQSPCVDAGNVSAESLELHTYTTRTDSIADGGFVDIGYHYPWGIVIGVAETQNSKLKTQSLKVYPNPFTQKTHIEFRIQSIESKDKKLSTLDSQLLTLKIYDLSGRLIRKFPINESKLTTHEVTWDALDKSGKRVSSGIYFCILETPDFKQIKKLVVLR